MKYLINPADIYRPIRRKTRLQVGEIRALIALNYSALPLSMDDLLLKKMRIDYRALNELREIRASVEVLLKKNLIIETPGKPPTYRVSLEGVAMTERIKAILEDYKQSTNLI